MEEENGRIPQKPKGMRGMIIQSINGRTTREVESFVNKRRVCALAAANFWSSTEYNSNNAWNCNFSSYNTNNNNKYNAMRVRPVAALADSEFRVSILEAYDDCCKHKKSSFNCIMFRLNDEVLMELADAIQERRYQPTTSETFIVKVPKYREIFAASFIDRIVQHWIYLRVNPLLEQRFRQQGDVSFNCRKGYGTLAARKKVYDDMHSYGFGNDLYVGKFDIHSFFMSIDLEILWRDLKTFIIDNYHENDLDTLLYLTEVTVMHRPQNNCIRKGQLQLWDYIPASKSLFGRNENKGMAIGNITAQILCNFYLSFYDEWLMDRIQQLGFDNPQKHYCRFVDDFVIHSLPKNIIVQLYKETIVWLRENCHLELHQDKVYIQPQRHGVTFVGGVIMPGRVYLINRTVGAMWNRMQYMERLCRSIYEFGSSRVKLDTLKHSVSSLNSYEGFMRYARTYNLQKKMLLDLTYFWKVCYTTNNLGVVKIKKKYKLANYLYNEERLQQREAAALRKRQLRARKNHPFRRKGRARR